MNERKPSEERIWEKYYEKGASDYANNIPQGKTVWDVIEEKLYEYYDIPALEYFKKVISKEEFINSVYTWARTFRAMGIEEDEVVPVYGPFFPDICAMTFALNMIGTCPYFLKLAISEEALREETKDSKVAVVYDGMWKNVAKEFSKDRFKKVLMATATDDMPSHKKEIISFISSMEARKNKSRIPNDKKYVWLDDAKKIAEYYTGNVKVPFIQDRPAFITSSSGTTVDGIVKGTVATNESTISQLYMSDASGVQYFSGDRCLCPYPPTASTALNVMFLMSLYQGLTVVLDPRISVKDFYRQILTLKPNIVLTTGSMWELFFNIVDKKMLDGKTFDFSYAKGWTVGGEGTDVRKYQKWNEIMKKANAYNLLFSGYGSSELFSATSVEKVNARYDFSKKIMSVGIPYAGITMGFFDKNGNELSYNQRGELRIKSKSAMKEYYNKPEATRKVKINGWICTGDLAEIDENGFIYIWGRTTDKLNTANGNEVYLFDVANKIKENDFIDDAIVLLMPTQDNQNSLVAHIVWNQSIAKEDKKQYFIQMNESLKHYLPSDVELVAYSEHDIILPYYPITLKKDKNKLSKQTMGYKQIIDGEMNNVEFISDENGKYVKKCDIIEKNKRLIRTK